MHRLPMRCTNGFWEVEVPFNHHAEWIRCESQQHAQQMSLSGNLAFQALDGKPLSDEGIVALEDAIRLFLKYGCTARASWLHEHLKHAKGEPSIYDSPGPPPTNT